MAPTFATTGITDPAVYQAVLEKLREQKRRDAFAELAQGAPFSYQDDMTGWFYWRVASA